MLDMTIVQKDLDSIDKYIGGESPLVIQDNLQKAARQDDLVILKKYLKQIDNERLEIVTPLNNEVKEINAVWGKWLDACQKRIDRISKALLQYNNIERETENQKRLSEAQVVNVDASIDQLPATIIKSKTESSTMTESETIEEFKINNHVKACLWMIANSLGGSLKLDKTVETAVKKFLLNNPDIKLDEEMGFYFKRGFKLNTRARQ